MTNLQRLTGKIFGETATATGDDPQIGQFGSALNGTYVGTTDVATIQGLPAWSNGFIDSVTPNEQFPPLPEMTGFGKVLSYQTAYTLQKGIPEWDPGTTYYTGDFCKGIGEGKLYVSKIDSNINNDLTDTNSWEEFSSGNSRNIGEIVTSTIPLTDAGLHLLDGALIDGNGSYAGFVTYIAGLVTDYPNLFTTEANWQAEVLATGFCDKYVYDSTNNTVRLPKIGNQLVHNLPSTLGVKGNGMTLGITDGTSLAGFCVNDSSNTPFLAANTGGSYGSAVGFLPSRGALGNGKSMGITTDSTKSGLVAETDNINTADVYYYVVIATTTKTAIQVDIDEIATDLNGKMDVDGTNAISSVKNFDGEWVNSFLELANGATASSNMNVTYDLSQYLPDDNYSYEVLFATGGSTTASSGGLLNFRLATDIINSSVTVFIARTRSNATVDSGGSIILPVGTGRTCIATTTAATTGGTYILTARGYRRIGTNQ